jgi:hypothetical protein
MIFWSLEHEEMWRCDFMRIFKELDENEGIINVIENEKGKDRQLLALEKYRSNISICLLIMKSY